MIGSLEHKIKDQDSALRSIETNKPDKEHGRSMSSKEKKDYRCEQCGINFDSLEAFTQHDKEKHIE